MPEKLHRMVSHTVSYNPGILTVSVTVSVARAKVTN